MVSCFCDGSSHASGGKPGGWAFAVVCNDEIVVADSGGDPSTTNNVMELTAILRGLETMLVAWDGVTRVEIVSDSQYALGAATRTTTPSKNVELCQAVAAAYASFGPHIRARWVKGHAGDRFNEWVDNAARMAKNAVTEALGGARQHVQPGDVDGPAASRGG